MSWYETKQMKKRDENLRKSMQPGGYLAGGAAASLIFDDFVVYGTP